MLPGDRLVCVFIEPQAVGTIFKTWLLHVTIVPWFRLSDSSTQIAQGLEAALSAIRPFKIQISSEELNLGPKRNRLAHALRPSDLPNVEQKVRGYLHKKRAWLVDETTKHQRPFLPHVTYQADKHLEPGDTFVCNQLYLVEQIGPHKKVVAAIPLNHRTNQLHS